MDNTIILAGSVVAIWVVFMFMRAPATIIFFALLVGQLLSQQLGDDAFNLVNDYVGVNDVRFVYVVLLVLPVILTLIVLRGRVSPSKRLIEALPLLLAAASIMIFIDSYLALSKNLPPEQVTLLRTYEGIVVGAGAVLSLVSSWLSYPRLHKGKKKHH